MNVPFIQSSFIQIYVQGQEEKLMLLGQLAEGSCAKIHRFSYFVVTLSLYYVRFCFIKHHALHMMIMN